MYPGKDPYFVHYYRINFDGTGLTPLTDGDANHVVSFSTRHEVLRRHLLARRPAAGLRAARARATAALVARARARRHHRAAESRAGSAPEVFVAKARDGKTDIWGVIYPADELRSVEEVSGDREHLRRAAGLVRAEVVRRLQRDAGAGRARLHRRADRRHGHVEPLEGVPRRRVEEPRRRRLPRSHPLAQGGRREVSVLRHHARRHLRHLGRRTELARRRCSSIRSSTRSAVSSAGCHDNRMDKIWWNEQWMGWPLGPQYAASSNVDNAHKLQGKLLLVVGELDTNVDPASTMQVVNAADQAEQELRPARDSRRAAHGPAAPTASTSASTSSCGTCSA